MRCLRSAGVSIDALIEFVTLYLQGDSTAAARKAILVEQREIFTRAGWISLMLR